MSGGADVAWDVQVTSLTDSSGGNALTSAHTPVGITYDFDTGALTSAASFGIDFNALTTGPSFNAGGSTTTDMVGTTSTIGGLTLSAVPNGSASPGQLTALVDLPHDGGDLRQPGRGL